MSHHVYFTAVARVSDGLIVGSYIHSPAVHGTKDKLLGTIKKMTSNSEFSKRAQPEKRFSLESDNFNVNFQASEGYAFFVLTHPSYPERVVFQLVSEMKTDVFEAHRASADRAGQDEEDGLSARMKFGMSKLCQQYDDPANVDKLLAARKKVDQTTAQLANTVDKMVILNEHADIAIEETGNMANEAENFAEEAEDFHQQLACYRRKLTWIIVGVSAGAILVLIIIILIVAAGNGAFNEPATRRMLRGWSA